MDHRIPGRRHPELGREVGRSHSDLSMQGNGCSDDIANDAYSSRRYGPSGRRGRGAGSCGRHESVSVRLFMAD